MLWMFAAVQGRCRQIVVNLDGAINETLCKCAFIADLYKRLPPFTENPRALILGNRASGIGRFRLLRA
jgi:hypothetical protein